MAWSLDARIPLTLLPPGGDLAATLAGGKPAALLAEAPPEPLPPGAVAQVSFDPAGPSHAASCTCCAGRSAAAAALDRLFQARVRGACAWFDRVVAVVETEDARAEVEAALREDAVTSARFRKA
ncbi:hypothetical protein G3576_20115 [Roseomonas stagni]|uniref:Uncharacterized protein n=1 Tax=Falsiroseomonas algicola TaxID=2716930 RepID=A0A6M1LRQ0_9PROT|nr:hypothetical protein [Falsiroseomonas algicola]NGM22334.1 hypothetical protein [Falsiroseomonas algicola]